MELYHLDTSNTYGYMKISAEVPSDSEDVVGEIYPIKRITTTADILPEIIHFFQVGASSGNITLWMYGENP